MHAAAASGTCSIWSLGGSECRLDEWEKRRLLLHATFHTFNSWFPLLTLLLTVLRTAVAQPPAPECIGRACAACAPTLSFSPLLLPFLP
jgi:hypothetical protein